MAQLGRTKGFLVECDTRGDALLKTANCKLQNFNSRHKVKLQTAKSVLVKVLTLGFEELLNLQKKAWEKIWDMADITIKGDVQAQQGIRFNIFQLNQTYLGTDTQLNIGPNRTQSV